MTIKRLFVPDNQVHSSHPDEDRNIRLLQYTNATTQENFDAFLTHHALVYILSGVKQIKVTENKFDIHPGKLFLIPRGEYVMSEYITGENGFRSCMLFFSKKTAQELIGKLDSSLLSDALSTNNAISQKAAIKIIQYSEPPRTWIRKKKLEHAAFHQHSQTI